MNLFYKIKQLNKDFTKSRRFDTPKEPLLQDI